MEILDKSLTSIVLGFLYGLRMKEDFYLNIYF